MSLKAKDFEVGFMTLWDISFRVVVHLDISERGMFKAGVHTKNSQFSNNFYSKLLKKLKLVGKNMKIKVSGSKSRTLHGIVIPARNNQYFAEKR